VSGDLAPAKDEHANSHEVMDTVWRDRREIEPGAFRFREISASRPASALLSRSARRALPRPSKWQRTRWGAGRRIARVHNVHVVGCGRRKEHHPVLVRNLRKHLAPARAGAHGRIGEAVRGARALRNEPDETGPSSLSGARSAWAVLVASGGHRGQARGGARRGTGDGSCRFVLLFCACLWSRGDHAANCASEVQDDGGGAGGSNALPIESIAPAERKRVSLILPAVSCTAPRSCAKPAWSSAGSLSLACRLATPPLKERGRLRGAVSCT